MPKDFTKKQIADATRACPWCGSKLRSMPVDGAIPSLWKIFNVRVWGRIRRNGYCCPGCVWSGKAFELSHKKRIGSLRREDFLRIRAEAAERQLQNRNAILQRRAVARAETVVRRAKYRKLQKIKEKSRAERWRQWQENQDNAKTGMGPDINNIASGILTYAIPNSYNLGQHYSAFRRANRDDLEWGDMEYWVDIPPSQELSKALDEPIRA